jgi:hypothetical protein
VLDDGGRRVIEIADQAARGVDVEPVGEAERGALQLARMRDAPGSARDRVQRAALVRVLAVAQRRDEPAAGGVLGRRRLLLAELTSEIRGDGGVVRGGVSEGARCEAVASRLRDGSAGAQLGEHLVVLRR